MKSLMIYLLLLSTLGCGFAERHPTQVKVYSLVAGAGAGVGLGLWARRSSCNNVMYEGKLYTGSPCPKDAK